MKITTKAILIVGLALLSVTLILYFVLSDISAESFSQLEARQVTRNVDRAVNAISSEITNIDTITLDWAWWDDTYAFIEDANERYINSNLGEDTLEGLNLNLMVYINSAGQTIFSSVFDSEQGLMPVPESLEQRLSSDIPLVHHLEADSKVSGILLLPEGPLIIAARPILPSNGEGPIRGSLIFGHYLDDALIEDLSAMTETEIHIFSYDNLPSSPEIEAAQASLSQQAVYVSPLDDDHVAGYTLLEDIYGQPALMLQAKTPREVYAQGQASTSYLRVAIITVGIVAIVVVFLLLDRQILSRLTSITKGVAKIGQTGDTSSRLVIKGRDELANLGNSVNQMLDALQASQQEIAVSEGRLRLIFESVNDILILMDTEGRILEINSRVKDISGYEKEEFVGKEMGVLGHITGRRSLDIVVDNFQKRMAGIEVPPYEVEIIRKDGSPVTIEISGVAVKKEGDIVGDLVIARDITPRKKAEAELRQSETRYRLLAENVTDVIWTTEVSCPDRLTYISPSVTRLLGYSVEEAMSKKMEEVFTHTSLERAMKIFAKEMAREEKQGREPSVSRNLDFDLKRADGSIVSVEVNFSFIRGADGRPLEILAVGRDITERKKAEEEIRVFSHAVAGAIDAMGITDMKGIVIYANPAMEAIYGYHKGKMLGIPVISLSANPEMANEIMSAMIKTGSWSGEIAAVKKNKETFPALLSISTVRDKAGNPIAMMGVTRDLTERKKMEERLILTDRLASVGELASSIAHELNNPLTGVLGLSQLLTQKDVPEDIKEDLGLVYSEAQRAANVVKNLLTFARKHPPAKELLSINDVISKVLELRAYDEKINNIKVVTHLATDLPQVMADYFQLQQVFLNIVINAEHFMIKAHNKGTLTITTERTGDGVRASVTDDGPGIPREDLGHIFNPFFTTKEVGKGTGLGLSICHAIISAHGGQIHAESKPGKGATFIVELPLSE